MPARELQVNQQARLVTAMAEVELLLRAASVEITTEDPAHPDAQFCLHSYFAELDTRFDNGFDTTRSNPAAEAELRPPAGALVVARLGAQPVGCGAVLFRDGGIGEVKRMWVAASARGMGLGRRILAALEDSAAGHGAKLLRLETNKSLTEAINLYRSAGFTEVPAFNTETYAHHWFEKAI